MELGTWKEEQLIYAENVPFTKKSIQEKIIEKLDLSQDISDEELYEIIEEELLIAGRKSYLSIIQKKQYVRDIFNSLRRLDILQELVESPDITEIMVNGPEHIFIEQQGKIIPWGKKFESSQKLEDVIQHIVAASNRIINESNPIVDARLKDGSRINIVLPPISLCGPILTIRKFPEETMTMDRLVELGSLPRKAADFLEKLVISGYNIFVSGGTGTGKTTFLNALSNYIPRDERIITIEDSAELQIKNIPNLVRLEVRNANVSGENEITIRDLIKSSLRMRPDRIIVGEVRDASSIDMLQALNTGHCGMSTGHANSAKDMLLRLETMVLLGAEIPLMAVRKQIASAIDIIIHLGRLRDRTRRVMSIVEVLSLQDNEIAVSELYAFQEAGETVEGKIIGTLNKTNSTLLYQEKLCRAGFAYESAVSCDMACMGGEI